MSFSLDLTQMMTIASSLFTSLGPVVAVIGGLGLGLALVTFIITRVTKITIR